MNEHAQPVPKTGQSLNIAFAVVVLASYFSTYAILPTASTLEIGLMIVTGIAYITLGTYGYTFVIRSQRMGLRLVYFLLQIPLGATMIYLGKNSGFNAMVLLPLAGHSVMMLTSNWMAAVNVTIAAAYIISIGLALHNWPAVFSGLVTFIAGQVFIIVFIQMAVNEERSRREVERLLGELEVANQRLRAFALQIEELAISKERNRLAREIHDGLGHYLTTIFMQIQAARAIAAANPQKASEGLSKAQSLAQEALLDVRRSVAALRTAPEEVLPLPENITHMLKDCEGTGIQTHLDVLGQPLKLAPAVQLTLYRAAQESLNNTIKHSHAQNLRVILDYTSSSAVRLKIKDDGMGSDHTNGTDGGFGLLGIRERVQLLEGDFHVNTAPGQGFELEITLPL